MNKLRLDHSLVVRGLVSTRSQAESYIRLGKVKVAGNVISKPGFFVSDNAKVELEGDDRYVSRAGLKLASVANKFALDFNKKVVLDVGSSTGGFTDYALQNGAKKVIAVEVGTKQLHASLLGNKNIELHEQTDIRNVKKLSSIAHVVVIDVSFISLREILPSVAKLVNKNTVIVAMVKPQFEAINSNIKHKGVIKNEAMRRDILKDFEFWAKQHFYIQDKQDSDVTGEKGNKERFYLLHKL